MKRRNPMSEARGIQARHRPTDSISKVLSGIQKSQNQKHQICEVISGCQKREQQNAPSSSGRNESRFPNAQALGDRLQSKEDENVTHVAYGRQVYAELGDESGRNTSGKLSDN